jgi:hypothetical protein
VPSQEGRWLKTAIGIDGKLFATAFGKGHNWISLRRVEGESDSCPFFLHPAPLHISFFPDCAAGIHLFAVHYLTEVLYQIYISRARFHLYRRLCLLMPSFPRSCGIYSRSSCSKNKTRTVDYLARLADYPQRNAQALWSATRQRDNAQYQMCQLCEYHVFDKSKYNNYRSGTITVLLVLSIIYFPHSASVGKSAVYRVSSMHSQSTDNHKTLVTRWGFVL